LEYKTDEQLRTDAAFKVKGKGCLHAILMSCVLFIIVLFAMGTLQFCEVIPDPGEPGFDTERSISTVMLLASWLIPCGYGAYVFFKRPSQSVERGDARDKAPMAAIPESMSVLGTTTEPQQESSTVGVRIKLPSGKTGGPFGKASVIANARQGKYPPGTAWSEAANGPWLPVPALQCVTPPRSAPASDSEGWWIRLPSGEQSGPYTKEQLATAAAVGKLPPGTVAANSSDGPWKAVQSQKKT